MKKYLVGVIMCLFMIPTVVFATDANSKVWSGTNIYTCTSKYQDSSVLVNNSIYFSHCMEARCTNKTYKTYFYTNDKVVCKNGNKDPYVKSINTSMCDNLGSCNNGEKKYCSVILYYDCNKKSNGSSFYTTTTTRKTTTTKKKTTTKRVTKKPTTKPTTTVKVTTTIEMNKKLKSLSLSGYTILFNPDVYEYSINVPSDVTSIDVTAVPQDNTAFVEMTGNTNIVNGSVIRVIVKATDGTRSQYSINIVKEEAKSSNANLASLSIAEYSIIFDKTISEYNIILDGEVNTLTLNYQPEDTNATVRVEGNSELKNGSKVQVIVTAEDATENVYTININVKQKSNAFKYIFIIILILAILAGAYYVYIKLIRDKKSGDKYEYE